MPTTILSFDDNSTPERSKTTTDLRHEHSNTFSLYPNTINLQFSLYGRLPIELSV